ncbi:MAG: DUF4340 domain-containing protein [Candidatus Magnetomorum sp.]|nr:DUF4340 domain-containing protein [Candidatus Magnetomorum sp.]
MKPKTMLFLVIILGIFIGISFLIQQMQTPSVSETSRLGGALLENLPVNDIAAVTINSEEGTVQLGKVEEQWVVKSRYNFPVDFKKLIDFVKKLKDAKVGRTFKASEASLARMQLLPQDKEGAEKDSKGVQVRLEGAESNLIADIITGKVRENESGASGGQYIRMGDSDTVYLTDQNFKYMTKDAKGWLEKELLDIKDEDIQKVIYTSWEGQKAYTVQREKKGEDPILVNVPEGRTSKKSELTSLMGSLSSLRIDDVENPEDKQTEKTKLDKLTYFLFNGMVYTLYPEKKFKDNADVHCLRVEIAYQKPPEKEKPPTDLSEATPVTDDKAPVEEKKDEKTPEELAFEAENNNKKMSKWTYILPKWKYENFVTNIDELLEEIKEEAPEEAE